MTHMLAEFSQRADRAIEIMKDAAMLARREHAAAELTRHMILTTRKFAHLGRQEAVEAVVSDWLGAWRLQRDEWPEIATEMEALTGAFYDYCTDPSDATDQVVRDAWQRLKQVHDTDIRTLEDQMAWRSVCAHGWWGDVSPPPAGYRDHDPDAGDNAILDKDLSAGVLRVRSTLENRFRKPIVRLSRAAAISRDRCL